MARILVSYFSRNGESTYDGICDFLLEQGHDIYRLNTDGHIRFRHWATECVLLNSRLLDDVLAFRPDIVLNFSYALPLEILAALPQEVKICLVDGDTPQYFWHKEHLKENWHRYYFLGMQTGSKEIYEHYFSIQLESGKNYLYFPPATQSLSKEVDKEINISFIGSPFLLSHYPDMSSFYSDQALDIYQVIKEDFCRSDKDVVTFLNWEPNEANEKLVHFVKMSYVSQQRMDYLSRVTDLGLRIYGLKDWKLVAAWNFDLRKCFDPCPIVTMDENIDVYNRSRIAINISHPQAKTAFSWRVMDIMASSACVLTEAKPDWLALFSPYIPPDVIEAVTYQDPYDMRQKAQRLLADDALRQRCVLALNEAIEKNGRWHHRFRALGDFLGMSFVDVAHYAPGRLIIPEKKIEETCSSSSSLLKRVKNRAGAMFFALMLFVLLIPGMSSTRKRARILRRLIKKCEN